MGLYKKEVLIRPNSTITQEGAIDWTKNWLDNTFQEVDENKNDDGSYKDYFFADIFDSRTSEILRVYTDACKAKYDMDVTQFGIITKEPTYIENDVEATVI